MGVGRTLCVPSGALSEKLQPPLGPRAGILPWMTLLCLLGPPQGQPESNRQETAPACWLPLLLTHSHRLQPGTPEAPGDRAVPFPDTCRNRAQAGGGTTEWGDESQPTGSRCQQSLLGPQEDMLG